MLMVDEVVYAVPMVKSDTNSVLMVDKAVNAAYGEEVHYLRYRRCIG